MTPGKLRLAGVTASLLVAVAMLAASASAATIPGHYIVVLKDSVSDPGAVAAEHGKKYGVDRAFTYRHALNGYAAAMSDSALAKVRSDPRVVAVSPDSEMHATGATPSCVDLTLCQALGNGVNRIDGELSSTRSGDGKGSVPINVAVLDTGIQLDHPDLNVVGGRNCASRHVNDFGDPVGHGTGVAGFIGALDNGIGRVGVAPGAPLWAVRVLGGNEIGSTSQIICGLDFVAATRTDGDPSNDIAVANMSLGGGGSDPADCATTKEAFHLAHCRVINAGVVIVNAAGNDARDFARTVPSSYDEVLTVTGIADRDGQPGALGGQLSCDPTQTDDTADTDSSFATQAQDAAHTIAAPGDCINSTYIGSTYATGSGTSFASPQVAGTVALCIYSGPCKGLTPAEIIEKIVADARAYNESRKGADYGFLGDPLRPIAGKYYGYLIRAGLY